MNYEEIRQKVIDDSYRNGDFWNWHPPWIANAMFLIMFALKLTGHIGLSWWIVTAPLWSIQSTVWVVGILRQHTIRVQDEEKRDGKED